MKRNNSQKGAVSLFVVIFAALLITVVTVSFVRIMIQNQKQASAADLSQSAYDSAQAGVEDAKRALLRYQDICNSGGDCAAVRTQINSTVCNDAIKTLQDVSGAASDEEIKIQNSSANALDQAYTCVKIETQTDDYVGEIGQDTSKVIPLVGNEDFDSIKIEWFNSSDHQGSGTEVNVPLFTDGVPLLNQDNWTSASLQNRPPVIRTQLIEYNTAGFNLSDFNGTNPGGSSNALFLYPTDIVDTAKNLSSNVRLNPATPNTPVQINCKDNLAAGGYACSATLNLPRAVDSSHKAYLVLKSFYKGTNYRITLIGADGDTVEFDGVQPAIDSTGRANDLFRRVQARVEMVDTSFPYPQAEIDINGNLCKNFMVTDADFFEGTPQCDP
jgi:Tfp pilus assembly protein PilX